jgi:hypothetical protein
MDPDPTVGYGSGSLPFQRGNVPKTILFFRVAEPEPAGAETFGRSWSRYTEVSAPAPAPGQTEVVCLIIIHIE